MELIEPESIARLYLEDIKQSVKYVAPGLQVTGLIASSDKPSLAYARATSKLFSEVGISYDLQSVQRLDLEHAIRTANDNPGVHGLFVYFPVFNNQHDNFLRNLVHFTKDIEAGSQYWTSKLYSNDRLAISGDINKKALLPCTPLAIVKILTELDQYGEGEKPVTGKVITIFNRSEVIGRPLAMMMSNDGATVYSFDEYGPLRFEAARAHESSITRTEALAQSDIVITGVPDKCFEPVKVSEINQRAVCINFSSINNFETDVSKHARMFVPRVGPMTVVMCMRNTLRLYENFHHA